MIKSALATATTAAMITVPWSAAAGQTAIAFGHGRVTTSRWSAQSVPALAPTARAWINRQLIVLAALRSDWDGYGAEPVNVMRLNQIGAILDLHLPDSSPAGSIVPGADGSIQAEWHTRRSSFGLLVSDTGAVSTWFRQSGYSEVEATNNRAVELLRYAIIDSMI